MKTYNERIDSINKKVQSKRNKRTIIWTASSVACVFIALTVVCSLPIFGPGVPNINAYTEDEYYPLIQKINAQYQDGKYSLFDTVGDLGNLIFSGAQAAPPIEDGATAFGPSAGELDSENKHEETTLNQVEGVKEGDLLKRSQTHAFYLKNGYTNNSEPCLLLQVYKLAGNDTAMVSETYIRAKDNTSFAKYRWYIDAEMFLSADATRLTVITTCTSEQDVVYTTVISLDVSNPIGITEVKRVYVSGEYLSSRLVDGELLMITNFRAGRYGRYGYGSVDYDKKETYVPQCGSKLNGDFIPMDDIYVPNNCQNINYTVLAMLDETTLEVNDSYAVFSYSQDVYVSRNYVIVMRNSYYGYNQQFAYGNEIDSNVSGWSVNVRVCEMVALSYKDGFEKKGETGLDGYIKDRYSVDEKDGVLRAFVTSSHSQSGSWWSAASTNVSLYCVDLDTMQVVASKENFAPLGDEVKSARFDGDTAYVCTARRNTDPVFYFDLSDLNNITYVDTGEIEGFSVNLIKFNDLLLGIGQGEHNGILKVELYRQGDDSNAENGVVGVVKYERECTFSSEYKAHFVDAEHNLIGLHIYDYNDSLITSKPNANHNKYLLLRYDEESQMLQQIYLEDFDSSSDLARAFYKDNGVYVFGTNAFTFIDLNT